MDSFHETLGVPNAIKIPEVYSSSQLRSSEVVGKRGTALYLLATYAEGLIQRNCPHEESRKFIQKFITKFNAEDYFTKKERDFLEASDPSDEEIGVYCWRWEALHFILWSYGFLEQLGLPNTTCQQFACQKVFNKNRTIESFMKASKPRDVNEVIKAANELEYIATCKDAKVDIGVLSEWRLAAKWLLSDCDWD